MTQMQENVEKNTDFVNENGELVSQSWDFTQRFFKTKEYIDEHHDIDYYFGDDYVK